MPSSCFSVCSHTSKASAYDGGTPAATMRPSTAFLPLLLSPSVGTYRSSSSPGLAQAAVGWGRCWRMAGIGCIGSALLRVLALLDLQDRDGEPLVENPRLQNGSRVVHVAWERHGRDMADQR